MIFKYIRMQALRRVLLIIILTGTCLPILLAQNICTDEPETEAEPNLYINAPSPVPTGLTPPAAFDNAKRYRVNFVRTYTFQKAFPLNTPYDIHNPADVLISTQFSDALGRPFQEVTKKGSPEKLDLVQFFEYDKNEREPKKYLPFTAAEGQGNPITNHSDVKFYANAPLEQYNFYHTSSSVTPTDYPFSQHSFEASSLGRLLSSTAPGEDWAMQGNEKTVQYKEQPNNTTVGNDIRYWIIGDGFTENLSSPGVYLAANLTVKTTTDENGNKSYEFKDKSERIIAKRTVEVDATGTSPEKTNTTYYVYDSFGNLRIVLPPLAVEKMQPNWVFANGRDWAFIYKYDEKQRLISKLIPGSGGETFYVYDPFDRLVYTQDFKQRNTFPTPGSRDNLWTAYKYDAFSRQIIELIFPTELTREQLQSDLNNIPSTPQLPNPWFEKPSTSSADFYYTNLTKPIINSNCTVLTVNYYDDYDIDKAGGPDFQLTQPSAAIFGSNTPQYFNRVKGKLIRKIDRVLGSTPAQFLATNLFYDRYGRLIQTQVDNYLGSVDISTSQFDFTGKVLKTHLYYQATSTTPALDVVKRYTYDHAGRLTHLHHKIGNGLDRLLAQNIYNTLGQPIRKIQGQQYLNIDQRFNSRGWLTLTASDLFTEELYYTHGFDKPQYNGNISGVFWSIGGKTRKHYYGYQYDRLNRLTQADYRWSQKGLFASQEFIREQEDYTVYGLKYDANSNILKASRFGLIADQVPNGPAKKYGLIDQMRYVYTTGNRLKVVDDDITAVTASYDFKDNGQKNCSTNTSEFLYDYNGNLTKDLNKGIANVTYNHLNLPEKIGFVNTGSIENIYTASGLKVRQIYRTGTWGLTLEYNTDYRGEIMYDEENGITFMNTEEGRAVYHQANNSWNYEWHLRDHLGKLRVTYKRGLIPPSVVTEEPQNEAAETEDFDNVVEVRQLDAMNAHEGTHSALLNEADSTGQGPSRSLAVFNGDSINIIAFAKYNEESLLTQEQQLATGLLLLAGAATTTTTSGEGSNLSNTTAPTLAGVIGGGMVLSAITETPPESYLQITVLDADSNQVAQQRAYLTQDARGNWEQLHLLVEPEQNGYVRVEVINKSDRNVHYDDIEIYQYTNIILQEDHYYPFGMNLAGLGKLGSPDHKFQFNGKEKQTALGLHWYDYGARQYDPQLGKFHSVDPLADHPNQIGMSPYSAFWNNPIRYDDPDGRCPECPDPADVINALAKDILSVKHSLYNLAARPFGYEATFVKNSSGNFETGFVKTSDDFLTGSVKYLGDALSVGTFGRGGGATGGLLAKTPGKAALTNTAKEVAGEVVHGNSKLSTKPTTLYKLETKEGEYLKTGVTSKAVPEKRYSNKFMSDKEMQKIDKGSRADMLKKEREIVEKNPGPLNKERWAGSKKE